MRAGARPTDGRAAHGRPRPAAQAPRRHPLRAPRTKRMNQPRPPFPVLSLKSAGGRAGAARLHAGFPGTLPLAPLAAPRRCLAPPRLLTKGFRVAICCPDRPPRHLALAWPRGSRRHCFEAQPGGAAVRACVCCAAVELSCTRAAENPAWSTRRPPPGVPAGLRRGSIVPQRAGACDRTPAPRGPWGAQWSPGPSAPAQPARPGSPARKVT